MLGLPLESTGWLLLIVSFVIQRWVARASFSHGKPRPNGYTISGLLAQRTLRRYHGVCCWFGRQYGHKEGLAHTREFGIELEVQGVEVR